MLTGHALSLEGGGHATETVQWLSPPLPFLAFGGKEGDVCYIPCYINPLLRNMCLFFVLGSLSRSIPTTRFTGSHALGHCGHHILGLHGERDRVDSQCCGSWHHLGYR